ncbi:diguanylate cyclase, partial [Rhizobium leguminosarum]|uniref:diguanylate cyclase n=1 Tax=Rhizobium leguminosarum TaxID=384 RepID=UPI003F95C5A7
DRGSSSARSWLKLVNDTFGHAAGDALIQVVADRVATKAGTKNTFRLGGDEFAVIVSGDKNLDLMASATDILTALSSPSTCDGHVVFPAA